MQTKYNLIQLRLFVAAFLPSLAFAQAQFQFPSVYRFKKPRMLHLFGLLLAFLAFFTARAQSNCTPAPSGLITWWPGDGFALDVASINNSTLQNDAGYTANEVGEGFVLGATNAYVSLPNNFFPFPISGTTNQPFSFEVWFKTTSGGAIFGQQNSSPYGSASSRRTL